MTRLEVWILKEISVSRFRSMKAGMAYLAEKLNVSPSHMYNMVKGKRGLGGHHKEKLCSATGEKPDYFYSKSDARKREVFISDPKAMNDFINRRW